MTNKRNVLFGFVLAVLVLSVIGASIDYRALNPNQFSTNGIVSIKSGATLTNITLSGGNLNGATNYNSSNLVGTVWGGISNPATGGDKMTILANGNVGIGTTTPTSGKLVVAGSITADTDNTGGIGAAGANRFNNIQIGTGDSVFAGNVGIGAAGPRGLLDVLSGAANTSADVIGQTVITGPTSATKTGNLFIQSNDGMAADIGGTLAFGARLITGSANGYYVSSIKGAKEDSANGMTSGYLRFSTRKSDNSDNEAMRITSDSNVGIGTNAPNAKLHVVGDANIRTNIAQFDVTISNFVIGTRYTNSNRRSFVAASFQLAAAVAGTAAVTMNVEQAGTTNKLTVSSGPLAGLTTIEPLSLLVGPGAFYYFTDVSSGAGAVATIVAGTSSQTSF